jgi:ABC-2 type transport system ATP-binding protein
VTTLSVVPEQEVATPEVEPRLAVYARGVEMSYGAVHALRGVDLDVVEGELFALLGPNGAGKTSFLEVLEGFRKRTRGVVKVLGSDPWRASRDWRGRVGVVLQESEPEPELSVRECLQLYGGYHDEPLDVDHALELVGLTAKADARCDRLSGGEKRRIDVAIGLIGDPELLFLDEPTTGFDPNARHAAWKMIAGLRELGKTIILTTHYMEEAEVLADRIAVLVDGRIAALGTARELAGRRGGGDSQISFDLPPSLTVDDLPEYVRGFVTAAHNGRVTLRSNATMHLLHELSGWAMRHDPSLSNLSVGRPTLEDTYLKLTEEAR